MLNVPVEVCATASGALEGTPLTRKGDSISGIGRFSAGPVSGRLRRSLSKEAGRTGGPACALDIEKSGGPGVTCSTLPAGPMKAGPASESTWALLDWRAPNTLNPANAKKAMIRTEKRKITLRKAELLDTLISFAKTEWTLLVVPACLRRCLTQKCPAADLTQIDCRFVSTCSKKLRCS
jgi:hypothetical protein